MWKWVEREYQSSLCSMEASYVPRESEDQLQTTHLVPMVLGESPARPRCFRAQPAQWGSS